MIDYVEKHKKEYLEKELKTKVYVLRLSENEFVESFDLGLREVTLTDDKYNAEHIHDLSKAVWYADRFACDYEEIEIED